MLDKQYKHCYPSQQRNQRGIEERTKGTHMGKAMLGKNRGSQKTDIINRLFV